MECKGKAAVLATGIYCAPCYGLVEWRNHGRKATAAEHGGVCKRIAELERQNIDQIKRNARAAMIAVGGEVH